MKALRRWAGTTGFRITLLHLLLTLLGTLLLAGIGFWATSRFATQQIAAEIERDVGVLLGAGRLGGVQSVALSVEARIAADRSGTQFFMLAAPDGRRLVGNLAVAPRHPGWSSSELDHPVSSQVLRTTPFSVRPFRVAATQSNRSTPRAIPSSRSSGNPTPIR